MHAWTTKLMGHLVIVHWMLRLSLQKAHGLLSYERLLDLTPYTANERRLVRVSLMTLLLHLVLLTLRSHSALNATHNPA